MPLRIVCGILAVALGVGIVLSIVGIAGLPVETGALTASYAAGMGTWLIAAQVARIRESTLLMASGGLLNPILPLAWMLFAGLGLPLDLAATATVAVMTVLCAGIWFGMRGLLSAHPSAPGGEAGRTLAMATVLVPHLALFAVLMQGIRLSAIVAGAPALLEQAHLAALGVTMVSVLINSVHALLSVRMQMADDPALTAAVRASSVGYGALALTSTVITLIFYLVLPMVSGVAVPLAVAAPLGLTVPALAVYYSSSAIQLRTGSAIRLLTASGGAVVLWALATVVMRPDTLQGLSWVYAIAPVTLAAVAAVLGSFNPDPVTRDATRLMLRRIALPVAACVALLAVAGVVVAVTGV
ncbi:hypothetical protein [Microbacterium sp. OVT16B]|uniref:hypothetical protein n=1 Tax=Microbacterium sp. OVT16B TaxID=2862682 RepID=UPI001CBAC634|nr:hypothetical protein [Microbacterium sp. OVT16B]